jgi:hypothetical protein
MAPTPLDTSSMLLIGPIAEGNVIMITTETDSGLRFREMKNAFIGFEEPFDSE